MSLAVYECHMSLHLLRSLILLKMLCSFGIHVSHIFKRLIPRYLMFLDAISNDITVRFHFLFVEDRSRLGQKVWVTTHREEGCECSRAPAWSSEGFERELAGRCSLCVACPAPAMSRRQRNHHCFLMRRPTL